MNIQQVAIDKIRPYENNPRNNDGAVEAVANSLREFGWQQPIVVDMDGVIIAGHTRYKAAKTLGMQEVPVVYADLPPEKVQAYRLADNKTGELAGWDFSKLQQELDELQTVEIDMEQFGFISRSLQDDFFDKAEELFDEQSESKKAYYLTFDDIKVELTEDELCFLKDKHKEWKKKKSVTFLNFLIEGAG